jgi:hypothetical protein
MYVSGGLIEYYFSLTSCLPQFHLWTSFKVCSSLHYYFKIFYFSFWSYIDCFSPNVVYAVIALGYLNKKSFPLDALLPWPNCQVCLCHNLRQKYVARVNDFTFNKENLQVL